MLQSHKKFLYFSDSLHRINRRYKLSDPRAVLILETVLSAYADKVTLTVLDLILMKEIASQATLHSVLKDLIENKLIKTEISKQDGRRKFVLPAKLGFSWLKDCSEALSTTTRKSAP